MFGWLKRGVGIGASGVLKGAVDCHSHILPAIDDGSRSTEESLQMLAILEEQGVSEVWLTPHIMEDIPNTPSGLKEAFEAFSALYGGPIKLHLAAENNLDAMFRERLASGATGIETDMASRFLCFGERRLLVETSCLSAPLGMKEMLAAAQAQGLGLVLAHPERYAYMHGSDYGKLIDNGILFQLNIGSLLGAYGQTAREKAETMLNSGWYSYAGTDCHRPGDLRRLIESRLDKKIFEPLERLIQNQVI